MSRREFQIRCELESHSLCSYNTSDSTDSFPFESNSDNQITSTKANVSEFYLLGQSLLSPKRMTAYDIFATQPNP